MFTIPIIVCIVVFVLGGMNQERHKFNPKDYASVAATEEKNG